MRRMRANRRKAPKRELPKLPPMPRVSINWRPLGVLALTLCLAAVGAAPARELLEIPVRRMLIEGSLQRVTELEILAAAQPALERSFLALDLSDVSERIADIDWVDSVRVQRVWPDTLRISFTEHRAAARWGDSGLLNTRGELFAHDVPHEYRELPRLGGPDGSHGRVARRYLEVSARLGEANLVLDSINMDPRGAFTIEFVGGLSARIGREHVTERIERFFSHAVPHLAGNLDRADYIDMRYASGFAVGWREQRDADTRLAGLDTRG